MKTAIMRIVVYVIALAGLSHVCGCKGVLKFNTSTIDRGRSEPSVPQSVDIVDLKVKGHVWHKATTESPAASVIDGILKGSFASGATVEILRINEGATPAVDTLFSGSVDSSAFYEATIGSTKSDSALLAVAYENDRSIGQSLLPVGAYLALVADANSLTLDGDINRVSSLATSILLKKDVPLAKLTADQIGDVVRAVEAALQELGSTSDALSPKETLAKILGMASFQHDFRLALPNADAAADRAAAEALDFLEGRQPISAVFRAGAMTTNIASTAAKNANGVFSLTQSDLTSDELRVSGTGVTAPVTQILVSIAERDAAGQESCLDGDKETFTAACPTATAVSVDANGAWTFAVPDAAFASGASYTVTLSAATVARTVLAVFKLPFSWELMPETFAITGPATPTDNGTPTVTWEASAHAASYDVVVATDAACKNSVQSFAGVKTTTQALTALADGKYYVCIAAINDLGHKATSSNDSYAFTVPPIVCDSGNLRTTCTLSTTHRVASGKTVAGPGSLVIAGSASLMTGDALIHSDDFSGAAINAEYLAKGDASAAWAQSNGILRQTATAPMWTAYRMLIADKAYPLQSTISVKMRIDNWSAGDTTNVAIGLATDPGTGGEGFHFVLKQDNWSGAPVSNVVQFVGDGADYGGTTWNFNWSQGVWYWMKFSIQGTTLYGKIWEDGTTEPGAWMYSQAGWDLNGKLPRMGLYPTLATTEAVSFDDLTITTAEPWGNASIALGGDLTIAAGGVMGGTFNEISARNVTVAGSAVGNFLSWTANGSFLVDSTGVIDASNWGEVAVVDANGSGPGGGQYDKDANRYSGGGGGGHGGAGGDGGTDTGLNAGGAAYGTATEPTTFGSAGGSGWYKSPGGAGGGAIHLLVPKGTLTVDGAIRADGEDGTPARCINDWKSAAGGGAGGSVWLSGKTLTGSGVISADGGAGGDSTCAQSGGGGGGGRLSRDFITDNLVGNGGSTSVAGGAAGTAFLNPGSPGASGTDQ